METSPLRERKQRRTRSAITAAALSLFAERGFSAVTVEDIAEAAEVGRTTFFRYFGDKQAVVFAEEGRLRDELAARSTGSQLSDPTDLYGCLRYLEEIVVEVCEELVHDPAQYRIREQLLVDSPELQDRSLRVLQRYAEVLEEDLIAHGSPARVAALASQVALACHQAGHRMAGTSPERLVPKVRAAFRTLLDNDQR